MYHYFSSASTKILAIYGLIYLNNLTTNSSLRDIVKCGSDWAYHRTTLLIASNNSPLRICYSHYLSRVFCFTTKDHLITCNNALFKQHSQNDAKEGQRGHSMSLIHKYHWLWVSTFKSFGSFHGPLSDLRQPPSSGQEQLPPRNSGNSLCKPKQNFSQQNSFKSIINIIWLRDFCNGRLIAWHQLLQVICFGTCYQGPEWKLYQYN